MTTDHLAQYKTPLSLPIQWGDQDAFGHVNNVVYFRWLESARILYLDTIGLGREAAEISSEMRVKGVSKSVVGPILASATCDFRQQLHYGDSVLLGTRTTKIGNTSITLEHLVVSQSSGDIAARGISICVAFDYVTQTKVSIPLEVRQAIETLEQKTF